MRVVWYFNSFESNGIGFGAARFGWFPLKSAKQWFLWYSGNKLENYLWEVQSINDSTRWPVGFRIQEPFSDLELCMLQDRIPQREEVSGWAVYNLCSSHLKNILGYIESTNFLCTLVRTRMEEHGRPCDSNLQNKAIPWRRCVFGVYFRLAT